MISVIIPTYNREKYIYESVMSVLNQTYSNIELIVVDDASSDKTEALLSNINDDRFLYIRQEYNKGACAARNKGISIAKGDYIAFQDSDDLWELNKLEKQLNFLKQNDFDLVYCGMSRTINGKQKYFPTGQKPDEELTLRSLLSKNKISTQTILCKKMVVENVKFDESFKRLQDWDFVTRVMLSQYKIGYLAESLVKAEVQQDSISKVVNPESSYLKFIDKNNELYQEYPKSLGDVYTTIAYQLKDIDRKKSNKYLIKSIHRNLKLINIVKLILNWMKLW